jgi:hypothetical protein
LKYENLSKRKTRRPKKSVKTRNKSTRIRSEVKTDKDQNNENNYQANLNDSNIVPGMKIPIHKLT